jgi:hypothetical protein
MKSRKEDPTNMLGYETCPGLDGWFGRAGGMRLSHLVGERATLSLWLVEGNSGTVVSVHFVWEDTTPTVDEIEKGGPDQYAWV